MNMPFKLTLRVAWWMQGFQILFSLPFTIGAFFMLISAFKGSIDSLWQFLIFVFLGYLGWANALSTIQITDESVTVTVFYGRFRINWNEVERIVLTPPFIALMGNNKRIVLSLAFAGRNWNKLFEFFNTQIEARKITFEQNITPFPINHQNTRVWR